jgi:hypothetical protein
MMTLSSLGEVVFDFAAVSARRVDTPWTMQQKDRMRARECKYNAMPFRAADEESAPLVFRATAIRQRSRSLTLRVRDGMSEGDGAFLNLCIVNAQDDSGKILGDCGSGCRDVACYVSTGCATKMR